MVLMEHLHELNARGHVLGVVWTDPVQLCQQLRSDAFGLVQFEPAVDDTMANPGHLRETDMMIKPVNQELPRGAVIGCANDTGSGLAGAVMDAERGVGQADTLDLPGKQPRGRRVCPIEGELDARGPAIDGQNATNRLLAQLAAGG